MGKRLVDRGVTQSLRPGVRKPATRTVTRESQVQPRTFRRTPARQRKALYNQVHFTDGNIEAQGLGSKPQARRSQWLLTPSLEATAGQGHWRLVSWQRKGNHSSGATCHPQPQSGLQQPLPARISSPPRAPPTGPVLPSALGHVGVHAACSALRLVQGRPSYQGSLESRQVGSRCVSSVPLDVPVTGLEGDGRVRLLSCPLPATARFRVVNGCTPLQGLHHRLHLGPHHRLQRNGPPSPCARTVVWTTLGP